MLQQRQRKGFFVEIGLENTVKSIFAAIDFHLLLMFDGTLVHGYSFICISGLSLYLQGKLHPYEPNH